MSLTIYIQDCVRGFPANGIPVVLEQNTGKHWAELDRSVTPDRGFVTYSKLAESGGIYRLVLNLPSYFVSLGEKSFYSQAAAVFRMTEPGSPLCIMFFVTPHGYSTYQTLLPLNAEDPPSIFTR